jgi:hypothetical protein
MLPGVELGVPPPSLTGAAGIELGTGRVGVIDTVGMSFVCGGNSGSRTYWVSRATRFRVGGAQASFFDLRTGERAEVTFHHSGGRDVADLVRFRT